MTRCNHLAYIGEPANPTLLNELEKRKGSEPDGVWDAIRSGRLEFKRKRKCSCRGVVPSAIP